MNGRQVFGTWYKTRWLLEHGVVDLRPLITHRYALTDFERALEELEAGQACKVIFFPGGAAEAAAATAPAQEQERTPAQRARDLARWAHR